MNSLTMLNHSTKKEFYFADIFKFVCAILIIIIHTEPLKNLLPDVDFVLNKIARIAVPFFYCCTGYFVFRKFDENSINFNYIKKTCIKFLRLYIIWSIIYFPLSLREVLYRDEPLDKKILFLVKNFFMYSSFQHLWYLRAGFVALLIILILFLLKLSFKKIFVLSGILFFIGLFEYSYKQFLKPVENIFPKVMEIATNIDNFFGNTRNGLFFAFFFICLGIMFAWYPVKIKYPKTGFVISLVLMVLEAFFEEKHTFIDRYDKFFLLPIVVYFLFYIVLNVNLPARPSYLLLRNASMWIYFIHVYIIKIFYYTYSNHFGEPPLQHWQFLVATPLSILLAFLIVRISKTKAFSWLKYLS